MPHFPLFFEKNREQKSQKTTTFSTFFTLFPKRASETGVSSRFGHFPVCSTTGLEAKTVKTQRKKTKSLLKNGRFWPFWQKGQKRPFCNNLLSTVLQKRTPPFFRKKSLFCEKSRQSFQFSSFFDKTTETRKVRFRPGFVPKKDVFFSKSWPKDCRAKRRLWRFATDGVKKVTFLKNAGFSKNVFFFTGLVLDPFFGGLPHFPAGCPVTPLLVFLCRPDFWRSKHRESSKKSLSNLTQGWGGRVRYTPN